MTKVDSKNAPIMVTIQCIAYNHDKYIREALEGFVSQITNFRFEVVIHDDASTDGTTKIIKEYEQKYPDIIRPIFEVENQYSKHDGTIARVLDEHSSGKYIAYCEGDDYWNNPHKLQKQVDFLESHSDYVLCYGRCRYFYEENHSFSDKTFGGKHVKFEELILENTIPTPTALFRRDAKRQYLQTIKPQEKGWLMGDYPMWLYFSHEWRIKFIDEEFSVYRVLSESASHSKDETKTERFIYSFYEIVKFFTTLFDKEELYNADNIYKALFRNSYMYGNKKKAIDYYHHISTPSYKFKIKYYIIQHDYIYNFFKNRFFYSLK